MQRAVLARELNGDINVLIAANPVFGLDFAAVKEIHARILGVRERGGAVLLISEDLDELLELADRIVVMSEGRIVYETPAADAAAACARRAHGRQAPPSAERCMTIDANPFFATSSSCRSTALVIIDMQRDFIEPGGFGETLGNDVALLAAIVPAVPGRARGLARRRRPGGPHPRGAPARPVRLPAGQAQPRQPQLAHRRRRARWAASW